MKQWVYRLFLVVVTVLPNAAVLAWWLPAGLDRVKNDFLALRRRVTARHILLPPNREVALALKQKIRQTCLEPIDGETGKYPFIADVFSRAAQKYSRDETTNYRGGLLGELVPQGYCRDSVLDRACFEVRLGEIEFIESDYGIHLVLVQERTNCPKLDGVNTKLVESNRNGLGQLVPSQQEGKIEVSKVLRDQALFWLGVSVAGGLVAEMSASIGAFLMPT